MQIEISSVAMGDIEIGRQFYEQQQVGLGSYFLENLLADIDALQHSAGVHPQFFGYCRALSKRFPYAIYYQVNGELIQIWRVLDCRQHPGKTASALEAH